MVEGKKLLCYSSASRKCLFFNNVSVVISSLTLSWCKSVLLLHQSWFMLPEDVVPYFLQCACLPKDDFFTTFAWKWRYGLVLFKKITKPGCLEPWDGIVLWKIPTMTGKAVAFWSTLLFQVKVITHPQMNLLPRAWIWRLLHWENAAVQSTHILLWFRHPKCEMEDQKFSHWWLYQHCLTLGWQVM